MSFQSPNYTQAPNDFFDMIPDMGDAELRVTLVMIRHTFGWHQRKFALSISELARLSGLSRQGALDGAKAAEERGTFKRANADAITKAEWELVVDAQPLQPVEGLDAQPLQPVEGTPLASRGQVGLNKDKENKKEKKESQARHLAEAKQRIANQRAKRGDVFDFLQLHGEQIQMINDMRQRVETALHRNLDWDSPRSPWNGYEKKLIAREKENGQTIEGFMRWFKSDGFRRKGVIYLNPTKIEDWWLQAFSGDDQGNDDYHTRQVNRIERL